MFEGEHASLNALHDAVPSLCPKSFAWGKLENSSGYFLVTDFLDMRGSAAPGAKTSGLSLGEKMGKLHSTPAAAAEGRYGFPVPTCCGDTEQTNEWKSSWAEFYAENRLMKILEKSERTNGKDASLRKMVEDTAYKVVPRLIGDKHLNNGKPVPPVAIHGDLWSGNKGRGIIGGEGGVEDVVFDPSAVYGHNEYEHGIMQMFGGFGAGFWKDYFKICPKTEPVNEYDDRVKLYELYHHLNHYAIFGGGYKGGAVGIMRGLIGKYGDG